MRFLMQFPISPPESIMRCNIWLTNSKLQMYIEKDRLITLSFKLYKDTLNNWSTCDFMRHYKNNKPLFYCKQLDQVDNYYMCYRDSVKSLLILLQFQYNNSLVSVKQFLSSLLSLVDKRSGKKNTMYIWGDSNAGKNFFFDTVTHFFINCGMIANPSKYERFPFMDCVDRRIIMWNEARLDPHSYEDIKQILAGDPLKAHIKHTAPFTIYKTPVLVLANRQIFPASDEFNNRLMVTRWRKCERLKEYVDRKPYPLVVGYLMLWSTDSPLCNYKLINDICTEIKLF